MTISKKSRLLKQHTVDAIICFRCTEHGRRASFLFSFFICCKIQAGVKHDVLCAAGLAASDDSVCHFVFLVFWETLTSMRGLPVNRSGHCFLQCVARCFVFSSVRFVSCSSPCCQRSSLMPCCRCCISSLCWAISAGNCVCVACALHVCCICYACALRLR